MGKNLFVLGRYPRSTKLRKTLRDYDEGRVTDSEYLKVVQEETALYCGVQIGAKLTAVQDPAPEEHDIFRPYVESWRGVYYNGLLRYFDNNFFYRIPVFVEKPDIQKYYISRRVKLIRELVGPDYPIKISIPGPVTFAYLSKSEIDKRELVFDICKLLIMDISRAMEFTTVDFVQIDEPFLFDVDASLEHVELVEEYLKEFKKLNTKIVLAIYFNAPRQDILEKVVELPVECICIDVLSYPNRVIEVLSRKKPSAPLALGIVNGREIMQEDYAHVKALVEKICSIVGKDLIYGLTTTCGFELIPPKAAIEKTILLGMYGNKIIEEVLK